METNLIKVKVRKHEQIIENDYKIISTNGQQRNTGANHNENNYLTNYL